MNLTKKKLQEEFIKKYQKVELINNKRIPCDKDLLALISYLVFEEIKIKDGTIIKIPLWTPAILQKFDLHDLSFKNAVLNSNIDIKEYIGDLGTIDNDYIRRDLDNSYHFNFDYNSRYPIDFSYTNIKLNFEDLFTPVILGCNLEGVDLKNSKIATVKVIIDCNFQNTNLNLESLLRNISLEEMYEVDFSNNDFSKYEISITDAVYFFVNNLKIENSRLNIFLYTLNNLLKLKRQDELLKKANISLKEKAELERLSYSLKLEQEKSRENRKVIELINLGFLDGCFVNKMSVLNLKILARDEKDKFLKKMKFKR